MRSLKYELFDVVVFVDCCVFIKRPKRFITEMLWHMRQGLDDWRPIQRERIRRGKKILSIAWPPRCINSKHQ